jgi:hypothetical protein
VLDRGPMRQLILCLLGFFFSTPAVAECDLDMIVGYTLVAAKYISGYIQDEKRKNDFEGCEWDRIIVFDDNTGVRCTTYSYSYSYHPKAYIFSNGASMQMCVDGHMYSVSRIF